MPTWRHSISTRGIVLRGTLRSEISGGNFRTKAASLIIDGGALRARGSDGDPGGDIGVDLAVAFTMKGNARIMVDSESFGGAVDVVAETIEIGSGGSISSKGIVDDGQGGSVTLTVAGALRVQGEIAVEGARGHRR